MFARIGDGSVSGANGRASITDPFSTTASNAPQCDVCGRNSTATLLLLCRLLQDRYGRSPPGFPLSPFAADHLNQGCSSIGSTPSERSHSIALALAVVLEPVPAIALLARDWARIGVSKMPGRIANVRRGGC